MSGFAIRNPYLIVVLCLIIGVVGVTSLVRMPVDMFPAINIPVVVVATFYNGMPPEQIETDITGRFERFFTLGSGIEHIESRSLPGVSLIKIFFQPGTNADSAVTMISNLAMANPRPRSRTRAQNTNIRSNTRFWITRQDRSSGDSAARQRPGRHHLTFWACDVSPPMYQAMLCAMP